MTVERRTFRKHERITYRLDIEALFGEREKSFSAWPVRAVCRSRKDRGGKVKILVSVSKRHFKHAVDRNKVKRRVREIWRLNRDVITGALSGGDRGLDIAFLWLSDDLGSYAMTERKMQSLLRRIADAYDAEEEK